MVWGGTTREQNYHVDYAAQQGAFDLVKTDKTGKWHQGNGKKNEDYYAFNQPVLAPAAGEVVAVTNGFKDNLPQATDSSNPTGNTIIIKTAAYEYILLAHLKQISIKVMKGDKVKAGQLLDLCSNSGNSSALHRHFHIQNGEDINTATGLKSYFKQIKVNHEVKTGYLPVEGDVIENYQNKDCKQTV